MCKKPSPANLEMRSRWRWAGCVGETTHLWPAQFAASIVVADWACAGKYRFQLKRGEALPWRIAGPGSGLTGPDLFNQIGWSTQVPPSRWIAVVGRPPQAPDSVTVYEGRSNENRRDLNRWEVSLLEAARCFDAWAEVTWEEAMEKYGDNKSRGFYGAPVRGNLFLEAASLERGLGPLFQGRCRDLAEMASTEGLSLVA